MHKLKIYNTLSRRLEEFEPLHIGKEIGMYTCGPTVYHYAHIGNLRAYVFEDILRRVLKYNNYKVKHVMNITDVGHLTDDADSGEDKMEKGAAREGKSAAEIADFYTKAFQENLQDLNILEPNIWCKATEHIPEQITQVQELIDGGFTYTTSDGIYFDTTKIKDYGKLARLGAQSLEPGKRIALGEKKNPHDFALWKFSKEATLQHGSGQAKRQMEWDAFGKKGFPGWHIECSAMSMKYLGDQFDIHCGGIDHIPVHHTNEIAQAESVTGLKPWVKYWLHSEFLIINSDKMSKSKENFVTLQTLKSRSTIRDPDFTSGEKNIAPLAYRYLLLQTHYRKQMNFTWEALAAAESGLNNLKDHIRKIGKDADTNDALEEKFLDAINNDLNTPEALAILWEAVKANQINLEMIIKFDKVLALELHDPKTLHQNGSGQEEVVINGEIQKLLDARDKARKNKNWPESDALRDQLAGLGLQVEDTADGQKLSHL